jgi:tetratricopeptide (TPR) repeat protein
MLMLTLGLAASANFASAAETRGERYALLVGVQGYPPGQLRSLEFSENDVNDLARALELGGYRQENVRVLTGSRGRENFNLVPTAKNIRRELDLLVRQCDPGDHVIIAFAGHGVQFRKEETMYFCPADVDLKDRQSLIAMPDVYKALDRCKADLKLLLVDACRNDPLNQLDRGALDEFESVTEPPRVPPPGGIIALFSCSATQEAMEDRELRHGVFFYYVIEALTGAAGLGDAPDEVTLPQLEYYVKKRVRARVRERYSKPQEPELKTLGAVGLVPLVRLDGSRPDVKHFRRALALKLRRDFDAANREMAHAVSYRPDDAQAYLQRGRLYYERDKYPEAIAAFDRALELDPKNVDALVDRGQARFLNDDADGAINDYDAALEIDSHLALAYLRAGVVRHNQKNYERALANYTKAIELDPLDARAWYFRGLVKEDRKDYRGALKDYDKAREINPRNNDYRNRLALMQKELNDTEAAIDNWTKATRVDPQDETAYFYRGYAYASQGQYDAAIRDYSRVLQINPGAEYALYYRGHAYSRHGNVEMANRDWGGISRGSQFFESARLARGGNFQNGNGRGGMVGPGGGFGGMGRGGMGMGGGMGGMGGGMGGGGRRGR